MSVWSARGGRARLSERTLARPRRVGYTRQMCRMLLALLSAAFAIACASTSPSPATTPEQAIAAVEASENSRLTAARSGDITTARQFIAPEFIFVHTTGDVNDLKDFEEFTNRVGRTSASEHPQVVSPPTYRVVGEFVIRVRLTTSAPRSNLPNATFRSLDLFTNREGRWLWLAHQGTMLQPPWRTVSLKTAVLADYVGKYVNDQGETRTYESRGGELVQLRVRPNTTDIRLVPVSESTFAVQGSGTTHTFLRDRTGQISHVQVIGLFGLTSFGRQ